MYPYTWAQDILVKIVFLGWNYKFSTEYLSQRIIAAKICVGAFPTMKYSKWHPVQKGI